jgi:hypothetical protein
VSIAGKGESKSRIGFPSEAVLLSLTGIAISDLP